jgi:excisionase family DNA binding protein
MQAIARQLNSHLSQLRRPPAAGWAPPTARPAGRAEPEPAGTAMLAVRRAAGVGDTQQLLRSHEVAVLFDVTERTVINWAAAGKLPSLRTIGGHLRFRSEDVYNLLSGRATGSGTAS